MGLKRFFKKITKPVSRFLDKIVPNEIKPFLPYAAAAVPFLAPASGVFATMAGRAALSGGANLLSQLSQEGSEGDFSGLSALLAAGTGALSAPQVSKGITTSPQEYFAMRGDLASEGVGGLSGAKQFAFEGLSKGAEAVGGVRDVIGPGGTPLGLNKASLGAVSVPFTSGSMDLAMSTARRALKDYEDELAAYELETGQAQTASDDARRTAIITAMTAGQHSQDVIDETLSLLGLRDGGIVSFKDGGIMNLGGREMDMRGGGFIPIGKKERADDVPARLSKNEFVMTADAVRGAGGGNINEGAKRMYETMNKLEARA
jgi:hypothetical protein